MRKHEKYLHSRSVLYIIYIYIYIYIQYIRAVNRLKKLIVINRMIVMS